MISRSLDHLDIVIDSDLDRTDTNLLIFCIHLDITHYFKDVR